MEEILKFLNAEIFSYMLHGAELFLAVLLFGIGVTRRRLFALRITLSGLCIIGLSLAFGVLLEEIFPYGRYLMTFLLAFAVYPLAYKVGLWENLFRVVAAAATQNTAFCAAGIFCGACGWDAATVIFPNAIAQIAVYLAVQVGVYCLCHIQMRNMNIGFAQERYPLIIVAIVLSVVNYIIQIGRQSLYTEDFFVWQIMFISCDVLLLCMLFSFSERSRLRKENIFLDRLRVSEEKQYELDKNSMEVINIKCHDLKHQLIAIRGLAGDEQEKAILEAENAVTMYDSIIKTGCKPLDVLLRAKYLLCEKYEIAFTYMVDGDRLGFMSAADIYSLFGNALDNAIQASQKVADVQRRYINLSVTVHQMVLFISIENVTEEQPLFGLDGLPETTKQDVVNHGYGMKSIRRTVESYGGVMQAGCAGGVFSLSITIPLP